MSIIIREYNDNQYEEERANESRTTPRTTVRSIDNSRLLESRDTRIGDNVGTLTHTYVGRSRDPDGEACRVRDMRPSWEGDARLREASDVWVRVPTLSEMRVSRFPY